MPDHSCVLLQLVAIAASLSIAVTSAGGQPSDEAVLSTRPAVHPSPPRLLESLSDLFGPAVRLTRTAAGRADVHAVFDFDSPSDLRPFFVLSNQWLIEGGALKGTGIGVAQIACLLPLDSDSCSIRVRGRSDSILEISLIDPLAIRYDGLRSVGRLHFGRMGESAPTDWMQLSTCGTGLRPEKGFRLADGMQQASLRLDAGRLEARLSTDDGERRTTGTVPAEGLRPVVHAALAGAVHNVVQIDQIEIEGFIDLTAERTCVLLERGPDWWGKGRSITLHYRARGHMRQLRHNGEVVADLQPPEGIWWPHDGPLRSSTLQLRHGDVLAFELSGVDDEGALHFAGVDDESGEVVMVSHPLLFLTSEADPDEAWFTRFDASSEEKSHLSRAQDEYVLDAMRATLGREFPGLPVIGPVRGPQRNVVLKAQVR